MSERWRVGRHFPIHIYEGEDIPVATALTAAYAKQIVADHNSASAPPQPDALKLAQEAFDCCAQIVRSASSCDREALIRAIEHYKKASLAKLKENENGK